MLVIFILRGNGGDNEMPRTSRAFRGPYEGLNWSNESASGAEGQSQEPVLNLEVWVGCGLEEAAGR